MRIRTALASLGTGVLLAGAVVLPAHAASYANAVCNSDYSVSGIRVYSSYGSGYSYSLQPGECVSRPYNGVDNLRVDVEYPSSSILSDVDSYKIGEINVGWGPCHEDSENSDSNPPDSYNDNGIRYRNYSGSSC